MQIEVNDMCVGIAWIGLDNGLDVEKDTDIITYAELGKMSRFWKMIENFILGLFEIADETCKW